MASSVAGKLPLPSPAYSVVEAARGKKLDANLRKGLAPGVAWKRSECAPERRACLPTHSAHRLQSSQCGDFSSRRQIPRLFNSFTPSDLFSSVRASRARFPRAALAGTAERAVRREGSKAGKGDTKPLVGPGETRTCDVVVVGSGIGGLSCAGLLARYGEVRRSDARFFDP